MAGSFGGEHARTREKDNFVTPKKSTSQTVTSFDGFSIAVVIPCYNEGQSIARVVQEFAAALPEARIFVYDNNSTDDTVAKAEAAGAVVRSEPRQGKGFVVRRMFADIEADILVMVDGDNTYEAARAPVLVRKLINEGLDMVVGARAETKEAGAYRPGHKFGNAMLTGFVRTLFGHGFQDMLSGYRVFSRRFVKSFPATSTGFEIETELTVHALDLELPCAEVQTAFQDREEGSESKLRTFSDGFRILWTIAKLLKRERPVRLFAALASLSMLIAIWLSLPILFTYFETGLVPRFPTLIVATGFGTVAILAVAVGLILDTVTTGRREIKRLSYLAVPGVLAQLEKAGQPKPNLPGASAKVLHSRGLH